MVKGYDPTSSDLPALLLDHLFQLVDAAPALSLPLAHTYVAHWLNSAQYTAPLYRQFATASLQPVLRLRRKCGLAGTSVSGFDLNFPTTVAGNQITICLDQVRNKLELKEHLDRELTLFHRLAALPAGPPHEEALMRALYDSCYCGYQNYMLPEKLTREMAATCSKYLFFRRSGSVLPPDRRFRHATQLAEDLHL